MLAFDYGGVKNQLSNLSEIFKVKPRDYQALPAKIEKLLSLSEVQKKEALEKEKKDISKSKDEKMFKRSKEISLDLEKISENQKNVKSELDNILSNIPNIPHSDVPNGKDENDNIEISKSGKIPDFDFKPKSHYELGEKLKMLDFDLATKTTGSRFVFVKNKLALLERALSNFMLDTHVNQNQYQEISPPCLLYTSDAADE